MTILTRISDGFANVVAGLGRSNAKVLADHYCVDQNEASLDAAYLASTWFGKIVDIPADDATREWRSWNATKEQIELLEQRERELKVRQRVRQAIIWSRLYGGSAIIVGGLPGNTVTPLNVDGVRQNSVKFLTVLNRYQLQVGPQVRDPMSPNFGGPEYFEIPTATGGNLRIDPSRVILINGRTTGRTQTADGIWGKSIWVQLEDAVSASDAGAAVIDALMREAKIDVVRMPDMMSSVATPEYENLLIKRFQVAAALKSISNVLILDKEDEWSQKQINWTGIPEVVTTLLTIMAGAADIPLTRLLGTQSKGLGNGGEADLQNYYNNVKAKQELVLSPALETLDEILIRDALGNRPSEIWYEWDPLFQTSDKERAEIDKLQAETTNIYALTGLVPEDALAIVTQNRLIESGSWPGADTAYDASKMEFELPEPNPDEPETQERPPVEEQEANDAVPKTLYVRRDVLNAAEIISHFKAQGFETTLPEDDLHVTITFSRSPVDWMKMGENWSGDGEGNITINAGGPRMMEKFGDATVLLFSSTMLQWRHQAMIEQGATWDHPEYQPHVTISYEFKGDLNGVEPYKGKIELGPEIFEEVKEDWLTGIREE